MCLIRNGNAIVVVERKRTANESKRNYGESNGIESNGINMQVFESRTIEMHASRHTTNRTVRYYMYRTARQQRIQTMITIIHSTSTVLYRAVETLL